MSSSFRFVPEQPARAVDASAPTLPLFAARSRAVAGRAAVSAASAEPPAEAAATEGLER